MPGNSFGHTFKITTFGESHGTAIGVIIDGCPAGLKIDHDYIQSELDRRKPGQSAIVTQRKEDEAFEILSGVFDSYTTGTPLCILIPNKDARSKDYSHIRDAFRPSHADFTYDAKYGIRDYRGGGRSSARETACRVAAGAVAKLFLKENNVKITAFVNAVGSIALEQSYLSYDLSLTENNVVRCPDPIKAEEMETLIKEIKKSGDTIGGQISCVITGLSAGFGEPVFDKLHADLAKAILSINACKGFEYGSGFEGSKMRGSQHNDAFRKAERKVVTDTNFSGGIQGGISNGMDIYFKAAFKPVATILTDQQSVDKSGEAIVVKGKGRHDPCVVPRAVPIIEAMTALVLADHTLRNRTTRL